MISRVDSASLLGLEAARVFVEVNLAKGLPCFSLVGLPDASIREAKDRVVPAIRNSGFDFPSRRVTVNLAPAELRKEGPMFDLAIAMGILLASEAIVPKRWPRAIWLGELGLDGTLRRVRGALPLVRNLVQQGWNTFVVPYENAAEIAFLEGIHTIPFRHLREAVDWVSTEEGEPPAFPVPSWRSVEPSVVLDMSHIKGQTLAKRALEIAAAGGHNLLMVGNPGTGKSMLAQAFPGILPAWSLEEALDASQIHSLSGTIPTSGLLNARPFRTPHHSASLPALIGGGDIPMPGEISLAHRGVLFLDELPEYRRDVLESLREPLEQGVVHIQRARGRASFPANFRLIAAMNPCPCGHRGHPKRECTCSPQRIQKYLAKISGPLLDRIDLHVELPILKVEELFSEAHAAESSATVRARVERAWAAQKERMSHRPDFLNGAIRPAELRKWCPLDKAGADLLKAAVERLGLSGRAFDRIRRLGRTIADLGGAERISTSHIAEAIQFRALDRQGGIVS